MESDNFPLKGRDIMAVMVNNEIISPLYSGPPRFVRYPGNSGISILKLAKNNNELMQRSQNCVEYFLGWINARVVEKRRFSSSQC
jgi:hypothetical protein